MLETPPKIALEDLLGRAISAAKGGKMRSECDLLGSVEIEEGTLYGIHAVRARENFPDSTAFPLEWYKAVGVVKHSCYLTYRKFKKALAERGDAESLAIKLASDEVIDALIESAREVAEGKHFEHFIVPAISGGAGTSINMNVNEIIANASLVRLGKRPGDYDLIDPIEDANAFQSTNDVIPTSLKVAAMRRLAELETRIERLRMMVERIEKEHASSLRIAYTQMQAAVPSSYGKLFATYSEALSRDWWRVSKCCERIKVINLGGSAVGTGLAVPRFFVMEAAATLAQLTGLPLARSENLPDATANMDSLVEAHAILKAHAVNLEKMVSDLRLLASDVAGRGEVALPARQVGSSIMPGKVNPVIPEFVVSCCHRVYANDSLIATLAAQGCLDLNAYLPAIGNAMLESLRLLCACDETIAAHMIAGLTIDAGRAESELHKNPGIATALVPTLGYHGAEKIARHMKDNSCTIFEANASLRLMDEEQLKKLLEPAALLKLGYSINELASNADNNSRQQREKSQQSK